MAPKKSTPPPIDRPLSKAYLRQFSGWSDEYPPGQSEPNSLRVMENVMVDRNGAVVVRPGLRYLSYRSRAGTAPSLPLGRAVLGGFESFYLEDGSRALLFAVREDDGRAGFRVLRTASGDAPVITPSEAGFGGYTDSIPFSSGTRHVHYVQIDNIIIALSDNGEPARHFDVGRHKQVSVPRGLSGPRWGVGDKLSAFHPDASWIGTGAQSVRRNLVPNPTFAISTDGWALEGCTGRLVGDAQGRQLEITPSPLRTNLVPSPLHDVGATGTAGWTSVRGGAVLEGTAAGMKVLPSSTGLALAGSLEIPGPGLENQMFELRALLLSDPLSSGIVPVLGAVFYAMDGSILHHILMRGPQTHPAFRSPEGTASMRILVGGDFTYAAAGYVLVRNVLLCRAGEPTTFFHGGTGTDYHWTGEPNASASVYHPVRDVSVVGSPIRVGRLEPYMTSVHVSAPGDAVTAALVVRVHGPDGTILPASNTSGQVTIPAGQTQRLSVPWPSTASDEFFLSLEVSAPSMPRGAALRIDRAMLEQATTVGGYFDGSTEGFGPDGIELSWEGEPHASTSIREDWGSARHGNLVPETPTEKTLVKAGGAAANPHKMLFYYTFENEVGESAASQITEIRMQRPWGSWVMETPNVSGEPSGTATTDPRAAADQIVCRLSREVFDLAISEGALRWNLYAAAWSDQDPAPVEASLVATREFYADPGLLYGQGAWYENSGWIAITPQRVIGEDLVPLPTIENLDFSAPIRSRHGLVAGDRIVLTGDALEPATIRWTSNRPGRYTVLTTWSGGGAKTLTSGNIHIPSATVLWQNPQSVDTLTVLCTSGSDESVAYYMQPATVQTSSSGGASFMAFEETTSTSGTTSPYGALVLNNALYRPLHMSLTKSTASNYNISHKTMTDMISGSWKSLLDKDRIVASVLDNRIYLVVHNPEGEPLREDCNGNEIWVLDIAAEQGHWSRLLIHASAVLPLRIGSRLYMAVTHPGGISYLDPDMRYDEVVIDSDPPERAEIPWRLETNLQGANRAHDAWAHVQQMSITLGSFSGKARWGMKGYTLHGQWLDTWKVTEAVQPADVRLPWSQNDHLLVRRDLMEWYFYAESLPGEHGWGGVQLVQYRYTPTTVNVGYEHGSVETFEYGSPVPGYAGDGVPQPFADARRSWV